MIFQNSFSIATTISFADTFTKQVGMSSGILLQQHSYYTRPKNITKMLW